jgi:predicted regulator of Ras-like GTPase activity (Roadblock/LC7/MglB family)
MPSLPQLQEEDIRQLDRILDDLVDCSDASSAMIIDKGGFLITQSGKNKEFDTTTIAALASGAYLANQTIANLVHEENFESVYQQGEKNSLFVLNIDENCLVVLIFPATVSVGAVKYYAFGRRPDIAAQMQIAKERNPEGGLDLSVLNLADTTEVFKRGNANN